MKISNISYITSLKQYSKPQFNKNNNTQNPIEQTQIPKMFAYQDFNISFTGRTPEDFYAQDFNRENMPNTMKVYLNYDYEQRQHMPPEQMMGEVFKYLDNANNFEDVKELYPNEPLFSMLHPNNIKSKKGILSEIKVARDLSDTPLLKDGSDDFGLYLLKKIYKEGKTLKEISKDFLEKDINDEYKGFITAPIDYSTTSAYGIKFPNSAFWHSFISTRDDYKAFFITLPKNTVDPNRIAVSGSGSKLHAGSTSNIQETETVENVRKPRKYTIKKYQKDQLTGDIKETKGDVEGIKRKVVKRFKKDDPEASFIVKYLSPIMTVAAERVHLSEEMRYFTESERERGKSVHGSSMFERFWKANPELLSDYSKAIVDTIEMFEDRYGAGGMIPINKEFDPIMSNSENQKAIDYVTPDFIELLNFTKEIEPLRNKKYAEHDLLQQEWENHFIERYGDPNAVIDEPVAKVDKLDAELDGVEGINSNSDLDLVITKISEKHNSNVFSLHGKNDEDIRITGNLDEVLRDFLKEEARIYPTSYASLFTRTILADKEISEKFKLSLATRQVRDMIDDSQIMSDEEFYDEFNSIHYSFYYKNAQAEMAASAAMADVLFNELQGISPSILKLYSYSYNTLMEDNESLSKLIPEIFAQHKSELDNIYRNYLKPISSSEKVKIGLALIDELLKYNPKNPESILDSDTKEVVLMLKEMFSQVKYRRQYFREAVECLVPEYKFSKCMLQKGMNPTYKTARFEQIINYMLRDMLSYETFQSPIIITLLNKEIIEKHRAKLSPELYNQLQNMVGSLDSNSRRLYEATMEEIKQVDSAINRR